MTLLVPSVKNSGSREEIITDLGTQACLFNSLQRDGEGFPGNCVNYCVIPIETALEVLEVSRFGICSNQQHLVIASDVDPRNH